MADYMRKINMKIPELLAPAGSFEHLKVAINAGASSVYLSGKNYGARKFAENFTLDEIKEAVGLAHLHNVKVYVTVNTLIKEDEIEDVFNYLKELYKIGVDAVIVQDLGLVKIINENLPNLKIHASTQLNLENNEKIKYIKESGASRVILPREMRKEEIEKINENIELEIFAHGALCYSYSGQCLMSSFKGGRSGNRGSCAQPCRQKYSLIIGDEKINESYYLSPKDLSLFDSLKEISKLKIDCIKIEGRMRNTEYLAIVISNYRKALNKLKSGKSFKTEELSLVFNREFIEGQFNKNFSRSEFSGHMGLKIGRVIDSLNNKITIKLDDSLKIIPEKSDGLLLVKGKNKYGFEISKKPKITTEKHFNKGKIKEIKNINVKNRIMVIQKVKENKKSDFNLNDSIVYLNKKKSLYKKTNEILHNGASYIKSQLFLNFNIKNNYPELKGTLILLNGEKINLSLKGDYPFEKAIKKPTTKENIKKQISKINDYPFILKSITINYNSNLFIPIKEINKLRRNFLEKLKNKVIKNFQNNLEDKNCIREKISSNKNYDVELSIYLNDLKLLKDVKNVNRVYLEIPPYRSNILNNQQSNKINISYMINFLKEAYKISKDKNYQLIWKWPDIVHEDLLNSLKKVKNLLNKENINFKIMNNNFNGHYGSFSLNISNSESIKKLDNYKILTLSPELSKKDLKNLTDYVEDKSKLELIVHGNLEVMKSRNKFLSKKDLKNIKNKFPEKIFLKNNKGDKYPVKENLSQEGSIILNSEDLCLIDEITYLKSINLKKFAIDLRWKDKNYLNLINIYKKAIDGKINKEELNEFSQKRTKLNY